MARSAVFTWPASSATAICASQNRASAGALIINGGLATNALPPDSNAVAPFVKFVGYSRVITVSSASNVATVNFTITGTYRNLPQSAVVTGVSGNTVATTALFDTVTDVSISATLGAFNVTVGTGTTGQTLWYRFNDNASVCAMTAQIVVTDTINYTLQGTLDSIETTAAPAVFSPIFPMIAATTSLAYPLGIYQIANTAAVNYILSAPTPVKYANILINSAGAAGALVATFVQQGVT
jgi:hypothetical protein